MARKSVSNNKLAVLFGVGEPEDSRILVNRAPNTEETLEPELNAAEIAEKILADKAARKEKKPQALKSSIPAEAPEAFGLSKAKKKPSRIPFLTKLEEKHFNFLVGLSERTGISRNQIIIELIKAKMEEIGEMEADTCIKVGAIIQEKK